MSATQVSVDNVITYLKSHPNGIDGKSLVCGLRDMYSCAVQEARNAIQAAFDSGCVKTGPGFRVQLV